MLANRIAVEINTGPFASQGEAYTDRPFEASYANEAANFELFTAAPIVRSAAAEFASPNIASFNLLVILCKVALVVNDLTSELDNASKQS